MTGRRTVAFDAKVEAEVFEMFGWDYDCDQANAYRKAMRGTLMRASCVYADAWESLARAILTALNDLTRRRDT